jgi:hypothetical protein
MPTASAKAIGFDPGVSKYAFFSDASGMGNGTRNIEKKNPALIINPNVKVKSASIEHNQ